MYTLFVKLAQFLNSQQEFLSSWLFWMVSFFRHPFVMWPFALMTYGAFLGSALLQGFVAPRWRNDLLAAADDERPSTVAAVAFGITGQPDWRSNLATFRGLLQHGVPPATAFSYLISSYNLTLYFFLLITVTNGPQITIGHVIAVLLMIACVRLGFRWLIPQTLWEQASFADATGSQAVRHPVTQTRSTRLASLRAWGRAAKALVHDVKVLVIPLFLGLFLGGFLAAWGYTDHFVELSLDGGAPGQLVNAVIGPILGILTFMVPVGNILVANWLWKTGFLAYAGVVGFFLATVLHPDTIGVYRQLFGTSLTCRIVLILGGSAALSALAVTAMWYGLADLASGLGVRTFIEEAILTSSITPSTVPWFHEWFKPILASYMQDVMQSMPSGMDGGK